MSLGSPIRQMETNPYGSPTLNSSDEVAPDSHLPSTRPIGVAILAVLFGLGGIAFSALLIFIAKADDNEQWFAQKGLPYAWFAVFSVLFVLLALACSIGMWLGAKWSWWLVAFYYFFMLFGDICQLLLIAPIKAIGHDYEAVQVLLVRQGIGAIINFCFLRYLFKANVLRFFGLGSLRKLRAIGIFFGITLVFIIAVSTLVVIQLMRHRFN
jgi:hypothetical protein